jgi:hypothetical protein
MRQQHLFSECCHATASLEGVAYAVGEDDHSFHHDVQTTRVFPRLKYDVRRCTCVLLEDHRQRCQELLPFAVVLRIEGSNFSGPLPMRLPCKLPLNTRAQLASGEWQVMLVVGK